MSALLLCRDIVFENSRVGKMESKESLTDGLHAWLEKKQ